MFWYSARHDVLCDVGVGRLGDDEGGGRFLGGEKKFI